MYDLSSKFNDFYNNHVVLPQNELNRLHEIKQLNIKRLKSGLSEYNDENGTNYRVVETCVQGSVAMATVVQNEGNDYDIDVAVVFDKDALNGMGARAARNMVANALKRKTKAFNAEPEIKTSCVRVKYNDGYHIDFAIYRRDMPKGASKYRYEHAGQEWQPRELRGLKEWFKEENTATNDILRQVVRLSKTFCKSRSSWVNMPSGLIQTVICDEQLKASYSRLDEQFYYTMVGVVSRIENNLLVCAPVDNGRALVTRESDRQKMRNWKSRLKSKLADLDILFSESCSEKDAIDAWGIFFNNSYWDNLAEQSNARNMSLAQSYVATHSDTEEFIEDMYPLDLKQYLQLSCVVEGDGFRRMPVLKFLKNYFPAFGGFLPHGFKITCSVEWTSVSEPDAILWKVRNVGPEAKRRHEIRGQIKDRGQSITEYTKFYGYHYIECYIIKGGKCVALERVEIPISRR